MTRDYFNASIALKQEILSNQEFLAHCEKAISLILKCLYGRNKLLIAGNGGSAADAQHFVSEIVGRFKIERSAFPAIALTTNSSILTAIANDYSFDRVFARQIEAMGQEGDIFIGFSTSGNSANVIYAAKKAKKMGLYTISFIGNKGGKLKDVSDLSIIVPSDETPRIQEIHILLIHIICEEFEIQIKEMAKMPS